MKKYTIIHNFTATASIEVIANNQEEAFQKARENDLDLADYNFELDTAEIGEEEDIPDIKKLILEAENILKEADYLGIAYQLVTWPKVTVPVWDGERMQPVTQLMEKVYWDEEREEIGIETEYNSELTISDILELQQYKLCQAIISQAEKISLKDSKL
jgi:hypothetical protein